MTPNRMGVIGCLIKSVRLREIHNVKDLCEDRTVLEWDKNLPFDPKRRLFINSVPDSSV